MSFRAWDSQIDRLVIGDQFDPHVGFVRRADMARDFGQFRFSPRPKRRQRIRKFVYPGSFENIRNVAGRLDTQRRPADTALEFQNADRSASTTPAASSDCRRPSGSVEA